MTIVVIPAFRPEAELISLTQELMQSGQFMVLVVDDGSGAEYAQVFEALPKNVILLRHKINSGKGRALKTAMEYIRKNLPECNLMITADADGQHRMKDIQKVSECAHNHPNALVLGSRRFEGDVPLRSRLGNGITRHVFAAVTGAKLYDTQTGLRAYPISRIEAFCSIPGERYEYEMNALTFATRARIAIIEEPIQTVYIKNNTGSHFHAIRDSFRIYANLLGFAFSSFLSFLIDFVALMLLKYLLRGFGSELSLLISVLLARTISSACNFLINRKFVFKGNEAFWASLSKYYLLVVAVLAMNYMMLRLFTIELGLPLIWAKLITELVLFIMSFIVQSKVVFRRQSDREIS